MNMTMVLNDSVSGWRSVWALVDNAAMDGKPAA